MKLAWLVWDYADTDHPEIYFTEPDRYKFKVVQIVYAEVIKE